jgi:hypothetical protein
LRGLVMRTEKQTAGCPFLGAVVME